MTPLKNTKLVKDSSWGEIFRIHFGTLETCRLLIIPLPGGNNQFQKAPLINHLGLIESSRGYQKANHFPLLSSDSDHSGSSGIYKANKFEVVIKK